MWLFVMVFYEGEGIFPETSRRRHAEIVIEEEIRAIPLNMYHNAMIDFPKRCQLCLDVNGEQFEAIK